MIFSFRELQTQTDKNKETKGGRIKVKSPKYKPNTWSCSYCRDLTTFHSLSDGGLCYILKTSQPLNDGKRVKIIYKKKICIYIYFNILLQIQLGLWPIVVFLFVFIFFFFFFQKQVVTFIKQEKLKHN